MKSEHKKQSDAKIFMEGDELCRLYYKTDKLTFGMVKLMNDGSIQGYTSRMKWPGHVNGRENGIWNTTPEQLADQVEKIHAAWPIDRDYMAPPTRGELAHLDGALLVEPPEGLEVGYVPIVTRQEAAK